MESACFPTMGNSSSPGMTNILAIAGGTGVSLTLPIILAATSSPAFEGAAIDFIWIIRRSSNMQWISAELEELKRASRVEPTNFKIHIFVTQEHNGKVAMEVKNQSYEKDMDIAIEQLVDSGALTSGSESDLGSSNYEVTYLNSQRPLLKNVVSDFMETRATYNYPTRVVASGPAEMGHDLRAIVAGLNDGGKVWKGEKRWDVDLHWDDRMGWSRIEISNHMPYL